LEKRGPVLRRLRVRPARRYVEAMPLDRVPTLSLAEHARGDVRARAAFAHDLFDGLKTFGFVILKDHGVDKALLARAYALAADFFHRPPAEKQAYIVGGDGQRGYTPFGREHAKDCALPDLKEFWHVGREAAGESVEGFAPNVWPDAPSGFRETFLALYDALEWAGHVMLEALTEPLGLDPDYFRDLAVGGDSILRILHYPPVPDDAPAGSLRAAPHEDINLITLLVAANGAGLELLDRQGRWLPVETAPENIIVDAGDMLARITNDVIPATTHRVVNPDGPNESRYSMPFFLHPRPDAVLSCIESCRGDGAKHSDITAGAFLRRRLEEIGLTG